MGLLTWIKNTLENLLAGSAEAERKRLPEPDATPDKPHWYDAPLTHWIAVRTRDPQAVAELLGLKATRPCNWESASRIIPADKGRRLFISGPAGDWVLLMGALRQPEPNAPAGGIVSPLELILESTPEADYSSLSTGPIPLLNKLSRKFGEAQFFTFQREPLLNGWAKSHAGALIRAYYFHSPSSSVIWNEGEVTDEEFTCDHDYGESGFQGKVPRQEWEHHADVCLSDEATGEVARRWSVDPARLHLEEFGESCGLIGTFRG